MTGMRRRRFCSLVLMLMVAPLLAAGCRGATSRPGVTAVDFHQSDPAKVGTTGRPQLLEFFGPT
jgi:hypothetical protein